MENTQSFIAAARPMWLLCKAFGLLPYWLPTTAPTSEPFQLKRSSLDSGYCLVALLGHASLFAGSFWSIVSGDRPQRERFLLALKFGASVATVAVAILSDLLYNKPKCGDCWRLRAVPRRDGSCWSSHSCCQHAAQESASASTGPSRSTPPY
ncbi:uncharacterized protein LOC126318397 [Schistocerca gregaria]|uniref:uncharacterized protein LOC126318397 n=1 Tax=Schistocerca gregaria TaxID=7010 RepID=UPI00211F2B4D|nr:uncharacterized protein LOC126318397 [Schistocerca gregaria]